jgi:hypothetical protein
VHLELILRRAVVTTGAALSVVAGGLAIRTAADWAVAATTKVEPPAGIIELQARIEAADAKAAAIRSQIDRLATGSERMADMIDLANALAVTDGDAADSLRTELDQTKAALANAEPAPSPTPTPVPVPVRTTTRTATTSTTTTTTTTTTRHDDDGHDDD